MLKENDIIGILETRIEGTDIFLVDVSVKPGNFIQVLVDRPEGISIDECVEISRYLNDRMDRDEDNFSLEVSSPGVGSPFRVRQQYENHIGRGIEVVLKDGRKFEGILDSFDEESIRLVTGGKKKKLKFEDIKSTKATVSFK
jgi:ribosome maturation factor RimP